MTRGTKDSSSSSTRAALTPKTSLRAFRDHYWYLSDLAAFCRRYGLPASGQKHQLVARIEAFLRDGSCEPLAATRARRKKAPSRTGPITLKTRVTDDFKSDDETRNFFKSVIGEHFHFTAHLQKYRRDRMSRGRPPTYGDLVREWLAEEKRRKDPNYKSEIAGSWQYNQFVRDFLADKPRNAGAGMAGAAKAWNIIREHVGPHTYREYRRLQSR